MASDNRDSGQTGGRGGNNNYNNSNPRSNSSGGGRSAVLAEFLQERWNAEAGFLDMDGLPPTSHNIGVVVSRLLTEAKHLFGDSVSSVYDGNKDETNIDLGQNNFICKKQIMVCCPIKQSSRIISQPSKPFDCRQRYCRIP
jgi:hypothetical protein